MCLINISISGTALLARHLILSLLLISPYSHSAPALPDLNSSTSTVLSTEQQNRLGESLYLQLKESGQLNSDPIVNRYINNLGQRLLAAAPYAPHSFTFFVVDNPQINAFAMFGGYIGIYSGLIRAAKSESELASVIAHEIAHITQDHLRRAMEKNSRMGVPVTVALLAAILLGSDAPELAEAAVASAMAGQQQQQLSFTRIHEREADRLGIERLATANFDPEAMARFFSLIQERSRFNSAYPEFLQTHPVTTERISEALDRARQLVTAPDKTSIDFLTTQARLTLSEHKNRALLIRDLVGQQDLKSRYTLVLALLEGGQYIEALKGIKLLQQENPNILSFLLTEADIYIAMKRWNDAHLSYNAILKMFPHNRLATIALVKLH
ncbi:MAG: M48 family metalloprotease, partial [Gammaproteobacteria bacterium]|nr:M48 family metalloprotease [Gammaproteobacteria bacterium]